MKGPELLESFEDNWETELGGCVLDEQRVVVRGHDLFDTFKHYGWMEYLLFVVTGKKDKKLSQLIESLWVMSTSYPEPRLWPNRIAALSGTSRSTGVLGISSGIAASEATIYGLRPIKGAYHLLVGASKHAGSKIELEKFVTEYLKKYKSIYGFGRPLTLGDERVSPVMSLANEMGFGDGEFVSLAFDIENILYKSKKMKINIAAVNAAIIIDAGLNIDEYYHMASLAFSAGMFSPMIDTLKKPEGAFFPLRVSRVNYKGIDQPRVWGNKNG